MQSAWRVIEQDISDWCGFFLREPIEELDELSAPTAAGELDVGDAVDALFGYRLRNDAEQFYVRTLRQIGHVAQQVGERVGVGCRIDLRGDHLLQPRELLA